MSNDDFQKKYQSLKLPGKEGVDRLLTPAEEKQLVETWNNTLRTYPDDKCICQLFEIQVKKTPDAIAVVYENHKITYHELNKRSNQLAHYLQTLGVKSDIIVGVCLERSVELIIGLLGILKAGGVYMPLDPAYPAARLQFMLEDARSSILVTQSSLSAIFQPSESVHIVSIDTDWEHIFGHDTQNPPFVTVPQNLAYVLYTSGSTGQPKGVACHHAGVVNLLDDFENRQPIRQGDACSLWTVISFDVSVYEIWSALLAGGCLHIAPDHIRSDPDLFLNWMSIFQINNAYLPPFMLNALADRQSSEPLPLRRLLVGVEPIAESLLVEIRTKTPGLCLINGYGPTEATICATLYSIPKQSDRSGNAPIGNPVQNMGVYVLDKFQKPTPYGMPGELYISGVGVAKGYLDNPELTRERFIPNPLNNDIILYRTGDKVRYLPDGNLSFSGRFDYQVKLRGFRIELGEIANSLKTHPDILEAVVILRDDLQAGKGLVAYFVTAENSTPNNEALQEYLLEQLPAYMIPNVFVQLAALPQTLQGKIDRRALPAPPKAEQSAPIAVPCTPTEIQLADIWSEVLEIKNISRNDNFFHIGGDSLRAVQIIVRVNKAMSTELPQQSLHHYPTIASSARHIETAHRKTSSDVLIELNKLAKHFPLSYAQQGMWLFEQLNPGTTVFHIAHAYHIKGDLNMNILSRSINEIIRRHESLRTVFIIADDTPVQVIKPPFALKLTCETLQNNKNTDHQTSFQTWIRKKACEPFNLEEGPLIRSALLRIADDEYIFSLTMHHIISDGWSVGVFIAELNSLYSSYRLEQPVSLPDLPVQYVDFSIWQRERYKTNEKRLLSYWKNQLKDPLPKLKWPVDNVRQSFRPNNGARYTVKVNQTATEKLKAVSRQADATLFMTLLAIYKILLYQFTGQTELMVGTAVANRKSTEFEPLIGIFMNPLVMRTDISENSQVTNFIANIKQVVLEAFAYDEAPYSKLSEFLQPNSKHDSLSQTLFFMQALFLMQTMVIPQIAFPDVTVEQLPVDTGREYADLTLELYDTPEGIRGWFEYRTDLFDERTISQLAKYFQILAESIGDYPHQRINELSPLERNGYPATHLTTKISASEWHQLLAEWNDTQVDYPWNQSIHQLFESQVEKTPDAVAVMFEGQELTYRELNCRANQLAHYLRESGVGAEVLVGICIKPSLELIVGLLGVLKADSVYVPLDPNYPQERIEFMVEDSKVQVILTIESLINKISSQQTPLICLDKDWDSIGRKSIENPHHPTAPNELAYVIYTSGSTGRPKAVLGAVRGVLNRLYWGWRKMPFEADEICCQKTSINFVDHVVEIFSPILKGVPLVVIPDHIRGDILELMDVLSVQKVTRIVLVPSLLKTMLENAPPELALFRQLKYVICSGEALPLKLAEEFHQKISSARLVNLYGSSEVAADVTYFEVNLPLEDVVKTDLGEVIEKNLQNITIPIGKPIANTQIYILDKYGNLLPPGVIGELYVGGDGLAKGYLNQPELTQKSFILNPFTKNNGNSKTSEEERLFRTGDLACWLPDGNIEFHGRIDHQVKLRGFRIELGEIEAVLSQHETVSEAVVVLYERDDNKFLAAYITESVGPKTKDNIVISELRAWLRKRLPDYMIPTSFTVLDGLPLTPNGKTDRSALPVPEQVNQEQKQSYTAPRDSLEQQLTIIWEEVLKRNPIGVHENFFELGGNSLAAVMLFNKIGTTFKKRMPPVTLYQAPSIAQFASVLRQENYEIAWKMIEPIQLYGNRPPFFFLGSIERAKALAPLLGSDQPFFRLNVLGFQLKENSSLQLREVAKQAYREIRAIQPEGPYFFGAFCYNAALAIEITRLLKDDKQRVAFMGVFDLFWREKSRSFDFNSQVKRHYLNLSEFGLKYMIEKIKARINNFQERQFVARIRLQAKLYHNAGKPIPRKVSDILLFETINATFQPSAIKRYEGRITHFMASEWRVSHSPLLDKAATDGVEVHIIDGWHDNMFFEPQVIQLGRQLEICLDREQPRVHKTQS